MQKFTLLRHFKFQNLCLSLLVQVMCLFFKNKKACNSFPLWWNFEFFSMWVQNPLAQLFFSAQFHHIQIHLITSKHVSHLPLYPYMSPKNKRDQLFFAIEKTLFHLTHLNMHTKWEPGLQTPILKLSFEDSWLNFLLIFGTLELFFA